MNESKDTPSTETEALWAKSKTPLLIAAGGLTLAAVVARARRPKGSRQQGSGVFGAVLKGALIAAVGTIPKAVLFNWARKALGNERSATVASERVPNAPAAL